MELPEFGRRARQSPELLEHYSPEELESIDDSVLALKVLDAYPEYWDMLSPAARRIRDLAQEPTTPKYWFPWFKKNSTLDVDRQSRIATIYCPSGHANISNVTVYSNDIGVLVENGASINLVGGEIHSNVGDGVRITSCDGSSLIGLKVYNNSQTGTGAGLRLRAANGGETCHRHRVIGCQFYDSHGSPTQNYGIWANGSGTVDRNVVVGNTYHGNATAGFQQDTWGANNQVASNVTS